MPPSGVIARLAILSFGLWFLLLPSSVLQFYTWFHRGTVKLPSANGVRIAGAIWLIVTIVVLSVSGTR